MKELHTLIKMNRNELDELRRQLVQLEEQKEQLVQLATRIHAELLKEREAASTQPQMGSYLVDYEKRVKERQTDIAKEVVQLDAQMEQLSAAIAERFGELKKYEIVRDQRMEAQEAEQTKREQGAMDEAASNRFTRKKDGGSHS